MKTFKEIKDIAAASEILRNQSYRLPDSTRIARNSYFLDPGRATTNKELARLGLRGVRIDGVLFITDKDDRTTFKRGASARFADWMAGRAIPERGYTERTSNPTLPPLSGRGHMYGIEMEARFEATPATLREHCRLIAKWAVLKHDYSEVREIVTRPAPVAYHLRTVATVLHRFESIRDQEQIGMHIHCDRSGLASSHVVAMQKIISEDDDFALAISGRREWYSNSTPAATRSNILHRRMDVAKNGIAAVRPQTLEFRLWKSPLVMAPDQRADWMRRCLEITDLIRRAAETGETLAHLIRYARAQKPSPGRNAIVRTAEALHIPDQPTAAHTIWTAAATPA